MNSPSDQELLFALLRSKKAAEQLSQTPLPQLVDATRTELGLTPIAYGRLQAGIELGRRINELKNIRPHSIGSSTEAIEFCRMHFARLIADGLQEEFHVITLNTKNRVIDSHLVTVGTLDASLVHPREVFRKAIKDAARTILLAHNHPSGDPTPSAEDLAVTNRLESVGEMVGIEVLDHIVMARDGLSSIRTLH